MSEPLTDADIDAMQARCDAAEPGPWEYVVANDDSYVSAGPTWGAGDLVFHQRDDVIEDCWREVKADSEFIAHARTDMPRLIDEVRRLRETAWTHKKLAAAVREVVAEMRSRATAKYTVQSVAFVLLDYAATLAEALEGSK